MGEGAVCSLLPQGKNYFYDDYSIWKVLDLEGRGEKLYNGDLVLDSNVAIALSKVLHSGQANKKERKSLGALSRLFSASNIDEIDFTRLRADIKVFNETLRGTGFGFPSVIKFYDTEGALEGHTNYSALMTEFAKYDLGIPVEALEKRRSEQGDYMSDRMIVARAILATEEGGETAFITADSNIWSALCQLSVECRKAVPVRVKTKKTNKGKKERRFACPPVGLFPSGFIVEFGGRKLRVHAVIDRKKCG